MATTTTTTDYNKFIQPYLERLAGKAVLFFLNKGVLAHELWLEKNSNVEDKALIDIMIGQNFKGTPFGFSNDEKEKLFLDNNNITKDIEQRDGNFPAIQTKLNYDYFNVISYESKYSFLEYDDIETFEDFVKEQNFLDILLSYKPNKLPTENYKRFSKILISYSDDFFKQQSKLNFEAWAAFSGAVQPGRSSWTQGVCRNGSKRSRVRTGQCARGVSNNSCPARLSEGGV